MKYIICKENFIQKKLNDELLKYSLNTASLEKIRDLIRKGADINCKNTRGNTPLINSITKSFTSCTKLLINHGADTNITNNLGETALHILAKSFNYKFKKYSIIADLLINSNIDLNKKNNENKDALDINEILKKHIKNNHPDKYENYLIKKDADKYNI
jgi:ankyrin repeat protein